MTPYEQFEKWFLANYGRGCVLSDPKWHAPKIFRAAQRALEEEKRDNEKEKIDSK